MADVGAPAAFARAAAVEEPGEARQREAERGEGECNRLARASQSSASLRIEPDQHLGARVRVNRFGIAPLLKRLVRTPAW